MSLESEQVVAVQCLSVIVSITMWYDYLFNQIADDRVRDWLFMKDPFPMVLIVIGYLAAVFKIGPCYMLVRRPFNLKPLLAVYNLGMVLSCIAVLIGYYKSGYRPNSFMACLEIDYSNDPNAMRILNIMWWTHIIKIVELVETIFFLLRKKQSQITFLHVYHHISTLFLSWVGVKYVGGGMVTFSYVLNHSVHVLMYSYYFLALFGPKMQKALQPVKKLLTLVQMIQFVLMLIQCTIAIIHQCPIPNSILLLFCPNIALNLYLFAKFYVKTYNAKRKTR